MGQIIYRILAVAIAFSAFGCPSKEKESSSSSPNPTFQSKPLLPTATGQINGQPWHFVSGRATLRPYAFREYLFIELWDQPVRKPCEKPDGVVLHLHIKTVPQIGELGVSNDTFKSVPLIIFIDDNNPFFRTENVVANSGFVGIRDLKETVVGQFQGSFTSLDIPKTEVVGSFSVPFCDENEP